MLRRAFSMIELVITIVVIGIVAASFPMILTQTTNSLVVAMQQEAILSAKTYVGTILTYPWDDKSVVSDDGGFEIVIVPGIGDDALNDNPRVGRIETVNRRTYGAGIDNGVTSISDFEGGNNILNLKVVQTDMDFILNLMLTPDISYVSDGLVDGSSYNDNEINFAFNANEAAGETNIKSIFVKATNADADSPKVNVGLRAYASNIGQTSLYGVDWQ